MTTRTARLRALHNQVARLRRRLAHLNRLSDRWSWIRLAIFSAGLAAGGFAFYRLGIGWGAGSLAVALTLFGLAVYGHARVERAITCHQFWLELKSTQIARMTLDWEHIPLLSWHRPQREHPFEVDLDLVGKQSLHHLLDTTVSHEGSRRLKAWLTTPAPDVAQTLRRQQVVRELAPSSLFRDRFRLNAFVAAEGSRAWNAGQLMDWLENRAPEAGLRRRLILAAGLAGLNIVLLALNRLGVIPPVWPVTFLLYVGLVLAHARQGQAAYDQTVAVQDTLRQFGAAFRQLEARAYPNALHLNALRVPFLEPGLRPSSRLARIRPLVGALGIRGNWLLWLGVNALVPWDLAFVYQLNRCKADMAGRARAWLEVWFELDALNALANLAFLNPHYTFPNLWLPDAGAPPLVFEARRLGHPLIAHDAKVCNDLALKPGQVGIITGANMAGKSAFLKTVGANLALAYAGGPVDAQRLQTVPFRLFTSLNVSDSITDGISYFYAEVKRLKALLSELERADAFPVFFFIDEIFRGTNNRERLIGSRAYVSLIAGQAGAGLLATHDLELARLAERVPLIENYHFGDTFVDGRLLFDYSLRPGPCPTTNALKIMALEGLIPFALTLGDASDII